jgi:menaquinone-specific isochorismate synthase
MTDIPIYSELFKEEIDTLKIESADRKHFFARLEKEVPGPVDIIKLITSYNIPELLYFKDKNSLYQFGGLGNTLVIKADTPVTAFPGIEEILSLNKNFRLFGGFGFSNYSVISDEWKGFNNCRFTLPLVEIHKRKENYFVILNYYSNVEKEISEIRNELREKLRAIDNGVTKSAHEHCYDPENEILVPNREKWGVMIESALEKINTGEIEKIVLSRKKVVRNRCHWDLYSILNKLNHLHEESFLFFYKIDDNLAFTGRSPERLFKLKKNELTVESIAGTRPRGKNPDEDRMWEEELLNSPKELEEHRIVSRFIKERMDRFCKNVEEKETEVILKLQNLQHIMTLYAGEADENINLLDLINSFHPTPAVGGHPKESIQRLIPQLEPFQRGWYAAPIGWVRKGEGNFAVGIRSALITGKDLHIFAGAGVVKQSRPDEEWNETDNKMDNFLKGIGEL